MATPRRSIHTFDIDTYLNHIVPRPRLHILPRAVSHFFGYRQPVKDSSIKTAPATQPSNLLIWLFSFLGAFIGIAIIENVYKALPRLSGHQVPIVIASFGAAAILEYNTIESPLAQPRNLVIGHFLSATLGVSITKLFLHLPPDRFEDLRWLAGALAVGVASAAMGVTKTVHPPAGATALLAATSPDITELGWWLLPLVLLGAGLMLASAMIINNTYRQFPIYWWTPMDLSRRKRQGEDVVRASELENGEAGNDSLTEIGSEADLKKDADDDARSASGSTLADGQRRTAESFETDKTRTRRESENPELEIRIDADRIVVPDWLQVNDWEMNVLQIFQEQIQRRARVEGSGS